MSPQWHGAGYSSNLCYTLLGFLYADLFYSLPQYIKMSHWQSQEQLNLPVVDPLTTLFINTHCHHATNHKSHACDISLHAPHAASNCCLSSITHQFTTTTSPSTLYQKLISTLPNSKNVPSLHSFSFFIYLMIHFSIIPCSRYVETLALVW